MCVILQVHCFLRVYQHQKTKKELLTLSKYILVVFEFQTHPAFFALLSGFSLFVLYSCTISVSFKIFRSAIHEGIGFLKLDEAAIRRIIYS